MKKHKINISYLFILFLATSTGSLSSCRDEIYREPAASEEGDRTVRYLSVKIRTTDAEALNPDRPEYVDGADYEHAVDFMGDSENVVIYIDRDYNYQGYSPLDFDKLSVEGTHSSGEAEEVAFIGFMKPNMEEFFSMPEYGMIVLNAHDIKHKLDLLNLRTNATILDVLQLTDDADEDHIPGRNGDFLTMSSSAYLINDNNEWKHSILFDIDKDKIFTSRTQAIMQPAAEVFVERMASKFSLTLPGADGGKGLNFTPDDGRAQVIVCHYVNGEPNYNNRSWTCTVEGWGINKYEPREFYFRNIVPDHVNSLVYPFGFGMDISSAGAPFFYGWNRAVDHRCFWSVDPHYNSGIYPSQYRPAVDNTQLDYFGKKGPASLAYLSYNDLSKDFNSIDSEKGAVLYSSENTFPDSHLGGLWQHDLAGSELVVGARMHIRTVDEKKADYDLYRNRIGVFYPSKTDFAYYFITTFNNQLNSQSNMTFRFYDWDNPQNNSENVIHSLDIPFDDYKLYYKDEPLTPQVMASLLENTMPAMIEDGDGKVIPWVKGMYIGRRAKDPETYEEVGEVMRLSINTNDFKSLIYDWVGAFDHFNQGRMVYTVPVIYRASQEQVNGNNYRPAIGDFGVVRNAWYSFAVNAIDNLGTPVDDLNQPIIPYVTSLENSIMMEIKVFDWHIFQTDVTLPGTAN